MSEQTQLIVDTVERMLAEHCTRDVIDAAAEGEWQAELWSLFEDAGLTHIALADSAGGGGGTLGDAMTVLRVAGRHACPLPLAETAVAGIGLKMAGIDVPPGPLTFAIAGRRAALKIERSADEITVSGELARVPFARHAKRIVIGTMIDGETYILAADLAQLKIAESENLASEARDRISFDKVTFCNADFGAVDATEHPVFLQEFGGMARASQMAGALEFLLDQSVRYALDREQFGRPLAGFQAVQQNLARLAGETAAGLKAAAAAVEAAERGPAFHEIAAAKIRVGEAAGIAAEIAHQIHGAMGFTLEYPLQLRTRRLWSWRDEYGSEAQWQVRFGRAIAARGADNVWTTITGT